MCIRDRTYTASRTTASPQTPVVFTATASGGSGAYEYRFDLYDATRAAWTSLRSYSTTNTVTWTPTMAGTYWVQVWVRAVGATSAYDDWRNSATVSVSAPASTPAKLATVTTSLTSATTQTPVVFGATSTGGTGTYEYRFALYDSGRATWTVLQNYAAPASVTWTPAVAGTYWMQVWVRSVGSTAAWDDWRNSATVTVTATSSAPVKLATFTTSRTTATTQTPVVFTASATGGTSAYEYRFALYDSGRAVWTVLQNYSTTASVTWTPAASGTYWMQVWVRAVGTTSAWDDWRNSATVTVTGATTTPVKLATLTTSLTWAPPRTPVTVNATATGGAGAYEYRFDLYDSKRGTWTLLRGYSTNASVTWTPAVVGIYWVQVWVRAVGASTTWDDWRNTANIVVP